MRITDRSGRKLPAAAIVAAAIALLAAVPPSAATEAQQGGQLRQRVESGATTCGALSTSDFDHIGEYVMQRMLGSASAHEAMNRQMAAMMGTGGTLLAPSVAKAHGGGAEADALAMQPARTLAQQALAELRIRNDVKEAAERLDAALESKDQHDVDMAVLRRAMETVDKGDPEAAIPMLDQAPVATPRGVQRQGAARIGTRIPAGDGSPGDRRHRRGHRAPPPGRAAAPAWSPAPPRRGARRGMSDGDLPRPRRDRV